MILEPVEEKIRQAILEFDWWDYGLDLVDEADPEYASHLAHKIFEACSDNWSA